MLLDAGSRLFAPDNDLVRGALLTLGLGLLTALAAAVPGLADWADIPVDHPARRLANWHLTLNLVALALFGASFVLRLMLAAAPATPWAPLALSALGVTVLGLSGYLGGRMIYEDGVAVGRHRRWGGVPLETLHASTGVEGGGRYVPLVRAADLPPGQSMRAEVNGYVLAIANVAGDYVAFQDFCTHRYAPLSLGRLVDGQVECPWHRSCFDVRTGAVTQGPAQVDLRTYPVRVVNGLIEVGVPDEQPQAAPGNGRRTDGARQPEQRHRPRESARV